MSRNGRAAALAAAVVSLFAAGCGGGDDGDTLSKGDYVKQGNVICKKGNDAIDAGGAKLGDSPSQAQLTAFVTDTLVPNVSSQIDDLRALKAPEADADDLSKLYDDAEAAIAKIKADPTLALQSDAGPFASVNAKATAYGLTECGSNSSS